SNWARPSVSSTMACSLRRWSPRSWSGAATTSKESQSRARWIRLAPTPLPVRRIREPFILFARTPNRPKPSSGAWPRGAAQLTKEDTVKGTIATDVDEGAGGGRFSKGRRRRGKGVAVLAVGTLLLAGGPASADLIGLPINGSQVNNDPAAGIDPNQS